MIEVINTGLMPPEAIKAFMGKPREAKDYKYGQVLKNGLNHFVIKFIKREGDKMFFEVQPPVLKGLPKEIY